MPYSVTIHFDADREFTYALEDSEVAAMSRDQARTWLTLEFDALECTPSNPMGKVLALDMILCIAKSSGARRFEQGREWARRFAVVTAAVLERPLIRVDLDAFVVT